MFFLLAKIFWFLLQPSSLILGAMTAGMLLTFTAWRRLSLGLMLGAIAGLLVAGLTPLADVLVHPLEQRFARADIDRPGPPVTGIIVLGGAEETRAVDSPDVASLGDAGERYTEAVVLARRLPAARLVFSGGSGALLVDETPEAETAGRFFAALGIAQDRITLEAKSRDTCENARFTAALVDPQPGQRWLLVTSAAHMPRAMGCFRRAAFAVEAWPVDYRAPRSLGRARGYDSISKGLRQTDRVAREYLGLAAYYLSGRIDRLFPAP